MALKVKRRDLELMVKHARDVAPAEACGILVGKSAGEEKTVEKVIFTKNVLGSPVAYEIDAEEILRAFRQAEKDGLEVVGFFHSHPGHEPYWSTEDEARSKYWVGHSFLIISLKDGSQRCYRKVAEDGVEDEEVILV